MSNRNLRSPFVLIAPALAGAFFMLWYVAPIGWTLFISLFEWSPTAGNGGFVGFGNYHEALFEDRVFWRSVQNSLYFTFGNVVLGTTLALLIANALSKLQLFSTVARMAYFMPSVFTIVAAAVVWKTIFQPRYGILNNGLFYISETLGLPAPPEIGWTTTTAWSMPTIILFGLWKYLGIRIILLLAAIEAVPRMLYEAATIDGVSKWQQFRYITVPMIKPALWFVIITGFINSLQVFEPMFVISEGTGGPVRSTVSTVMLINQYGFDRQRFGYAAAISVMLFALVMLFTFVLFAVKSRSRDENQ